MKQLIKRFLPNSILDRWMSSRYSKKDSPFFQMEHENVFQTIYDQQLWGDHQTISGAGSTIEQTGPLIETLNKFIKEFEIQSILDLPCGDFNWMQQVDLSSTQYIGADIVKEIIANNRKRYEQDNVSFRQFNLLKDEIPDADLIINRDCFVHFAFSDIQKAIENIKRSGAHYFATTTFPEHTLNYDIATGDWRPINLQLAPFYFPVPLAQLHERVAPGYEKESKGKMLGVWKVSDISI